MVIPFSNTKLRVPAGFQSLLVGLSIEVLRSQPRDIHRFAADYFEQLLRRREQGVENATDKQVSNDDRYYNNQSFQEQYPVNDRHVDEAATRIQAQFRGHKTRNDLERSKSNHSADDDEQEHQDDHATSRTSSREKPIMIDDHLETTENVLSRRESSSISTKSQMHEDQQPFQPSPRGQTHVNASIESRFHDDTQQNSPSPLGQRFNNDEDEDSHQEFEHDNEQLSQRMSRHSSRNGDSPRHNFDGDRDHSENSDFDQQAFTEDVQTQQQRDSPHEVDNDGDEIATRFHANDEMNDSNLDRAATRIQASYRGYKTRKQLGPIGNYPNSRHSPIDQRPPSISSQMLENYDTPRNKIILSPSAHGNQGVDYEHDDNAAAIKIQAAYRGYRVRRNLDK